MYNQITYILIYFCMLASGLFMHLIVLAFFSHNLEILLNLVVWGLLVTNPLKEVFVSYLSICIKICVHVYVVYASGRYMEIS